MLNMLNPIQFSVPWFSSLKWFIAGWQMLLLVFLVTVALPFPALNFCTIVLLKQRGKYAPCMLLWMMYVCIEVALRGSAHGIGRSNWAKGRDPSLPQPRGTNNTTSRTLTHTSKHCVLSVANFTLGSWGWLVSSFRRSRVTPGLLLWMVLKLWRNIPIMKIIGSICTHYITVTSVGLKTF